jgi:acyl-CoA reductase-like NAD-dependent aldehyde dehydrogenase
MKAFAILFAVAFSMAIPAFAGRHYDAPPLLDEMYDATQQVFQEMKDATDELREAEATMRNRGADWLRRHPEERDRAREHISDLNRRVQELRQRHRCLAEAYDGGKADYMQISRQRNPFNKATELGTWELRWKDRFERCR